MVPAAAFLLFAAGFVGRVIAEKNTDPNKPLLPVEYPMAVGGALRLLFKAGYLVLLLWMLSESELPRSKIMLTADLAHYLAHICWKVCVKVPLWKLV